MQKRILVISHNVFCKTSSMGKTLCAYFAETAPQNLAQFYIHSEVPTEHICENYYRVTDKDIIRSVFTRKSGKVLTAADIEEGRTSSRTDTGFIGDIYQKSRKRTPFIYFCRNLLWGLGAWNTKKLKDWVDEFNPDAVFLASGDYAFIYKIALKIAKYKKIPLYVSCMDDYYLYNKNEQSFGGKAVHKAFMKTVKRAIEYSSGIFAICDKMTKDYKELFGKPTYTLHTASSISSPFEKTNSNKISYIGNLGYKRDEQLIKLGRALLPLGFKIDIYSSEKREEILKILTEENGINFKGEINAWQVKEVMEKSGFLIHTESFDEGIRSSVKYSVSTKIADSLSSGRCIIAFGPEEIASIEYLKENDAAFVIGEGDDLEKKLRELFENENRREEITENAKALAKKNHMLETTHKLIEEVICL